MTKLAGQMLTTRGVAAFWLLWSLAFVFMLWAVSRRAAPCKTRSPPSSCKAISPAAISCATRRSMNGCFGACSSSLVQGRSPIHPALQPDRNHRHSVHPRAVAHGRERAPCRRLFPLARAVLLVRLGDPPQRLPHACAACGGARAVHRRARLCRAANGSARASPRPHRRHRPHGQMELPARAAEPRRGTCRDA